MASQNDPPVAAEVPAVPPVKKRPLISIPFLIGAVILGILAFGVAIGIMYFSMLNEESQKANKRVEGAASKLTPGVVPPGLGADTSTPGN